MHFFDWTKPLRHSQRKMGTKMGVQESSEKRALRELVEALESSTKDRPVRTDERMPSRELSVVIMTNPNVVSAMREAKSVLGIRESR